MFVVVRTVTYAALFVSIVLIDVPAHLLSWSGVVRPAAIGLAQVAGMVLGFVGGAVALWSLFTFVSIGGGTPAPFDPPRELVSQGPYRFMRNPIYVGVGLTLAGAAVFYKSLLLLGYAGLFFLTSHLLVVGYEEPALRRTFGPSYAAYRSRVRRWRPRVRPRDSGAADR